MHTPTPPPPRQRQIFLGALEIATSSDRITYIERECQGDATLRSAVDKMLEESDQLGSFLEQPPAVELQTWREGKRSEHIGSGDRRSAHVELLQLCAAVEWPQHRCVQSCAMHAQARESGSSLAQGNVHDSLDGKPVPSTRKVHALHKITRRP